MLSSFELYPRWVPLIKSHRSPPALYPWGGGELVSFTAIFKLIT